ncbi:MAG: vanadium-dependent haloperoxidase [Saprospiraceae bacterium]|nr:vanadium-dependent haloperoxidase [Saprospiraceae bacterium]
MRLFTKISFLLFSGMLVLSSCKKDIPQGDEIQISLPAAQYASKVAQEWNDLYIEIDRFAPGYRPCPTTAAQGYLGIACYEALVAGMPEYQSIQHEVGVEIPAIFKGVEYHWPTVYNAVQAYLMKRFFPHISENLIAKMTLLEKKYNELYSNEIDSEVFNRSNLYGKEVAAAVWNWAKTDVVSTDAYLDIFQGYNWATRYNKPGDWRPTSAGLQNGMFPYWGQARTFVISEDMKICRPPITHSDDPQSELYVQALEVVETVKNQNLVNIGVFWSDDLLGLTFSPPIRFLAIANQIYAHEEVSLEKAIVSNAKLGITLNDIAVGCWNSKYHYNVERPETYIRRNINPEWQTKLNDPISGVKGITPAFPAYPSGHSTFGAGGAEVLASEFGYSYAMTDRCHENRTEFYGTPKAFTSLRAMAEENAFSRIYLGVHFRMDCDEGLRYGTEIGRQVDRLPWKK